MTKKEIVRDICERAKDEKLMKGGLTQLATKEIVQWTFEAIIETLIREGRIELRNFGVFEVKQRKQRKARNPRTGDRVDVPAKNVVTFQPGKTMEEKVRRHAKPVEPKKKPKKLRHVEPAADGKLADGKLADGKVMTHSAHTPVAAPTPEPQTVAASAEVHGTAS